MGHDQSPRMEDDKVYRFLVEKAREATRVTYKEVAEATGVGGIAFKALTDHLHAINTFEHEHGRPLLGVIIYNIAKRRLGGGFFGLARDLGYEFADEDRFWRLHVMRVFLYWRDYAPLDSALREMELE